MPLVIGELLVRLEASTEGLQKIQKGMEEVANKAQRAGQTLSIGLTVPLAAIGTAAIRMGMDAVEGENLFTVSMGRMAESARKWSQDLRKELGLNEYQLRQQVGTFNVMFQAMGIGETAAYDMSKGLTQLAYDMSSFFNMQPEAAFEKLTAAISGQVQPLRQLGIVINETTIEQYALNHGMIKQGEQLSEQGKILARYGAIMEQTAVAQGDMARTLDSPANKLRILQEQIKQTSTEFGIALLPAFHKAMEAARPLVDKLKDAVDWFANLSPALQENIVKWLALAAAIGPVTLAISQLIKVGGVVVGAIGGILPVVNNAIFAFGAWQAGAATLSEALGLAAGKMSFLFGPAGIVLAGISAIALWVKHTNDTIEAERRLQTQHESTAATLRDLRDRYSEISGLMDKLKPGTDEYKRLEGELQAVMTQLNEILPDVTTATDNLAEARKRNLSAIDEEIQKEIALATALERTALQRDQARKQREIENYSAEASRWRAQGETSLAEHLEKQRVKAEAELVALNQRLALVAEAIRTGDYSKLIATLPKAGGSGKGKDGGAGGDVVTVVTGKTKEEIWREIIDGLRQAQREMGAGIYPEMRMALARGEKWDWKAETAALIEDTIRALYSAGMAPEHNSMQWLVREYSGLVGGTSAGEDLLSRLGILSAGRRDRPVADWGLAMTSTERQVREAVQQVRDSIVGEAIQEVADIAERRRTTSGGLETIMAWGMTAGERQARDAVRQVRDALFAEAVQGVVDSAEARRARSGGVDTVLAWGMTASERQVREGVRQVADSIYTEAVQAVVDAAETRRARSGGVEMVLAWGMTTGERQVRDAVQQVRDALFAEAIQQVVEAAEARRSRSGGVETVMAWGMTSSERQVREGVRQVADFIFAEGIQSVVDAVEARRARSGGVETVLAWGMTAGERQAREAVQQVRDALFAEAIQQVVEAAEARRSRSGGVETVMAWGMTLGERQVREGVAQVADAIFAEGIQAVVNAVEARRARSGGVETVLAWGMTAGERQVREGVRQVAESIYAEGIQAVVDAVETRRIRSGGVETVLAWGMTTGERQVREGVRQVADAVFAEGIQTVVDAVEARRARSGGVETVMAWGMTTSERQVREGVRQIADAIFAEALQAVVDAVEMRRARSGGVETVTAWKQTLPERQVREGVQQVREAIFAEAIQQVVDAVEKRRSRSGGVETVDAWGLTDAERSVRESARQTWESINKTLGDRLKEAWQDVVVPEALSRMPILNNALIAADQAAPGGPQAMAIAVLTSLLVDSTQFAELLERINPLLQAAADVVGAFLEPLMPIVTVLSAALTPALSVLAQVTGAILLPVMQALFPVFKGLGLIALGVTIAFGHAWNLLASVINAALGWLGVNLKLIDTGELGEAFQALAAMTWDQAAATEAATNAMYNVPHGFKIAMRRFEVATAEPWMPGGTDAAGASRSMGSGESRGLTAAGGGVTVIVKGDVYGYEDFKRKVREAQMTGERSVRLAQYGTVGV